MAKDPNSRRSSKKKKGEEFADLYQDDMEFEEDDFEEDDEPLEAEEWVEEEDDERERRSRKAKAEAESKAAPEPSTAGKLVDKLRPRPVRPGEHDVLQSPVVLGLFGGTLLLLLVGGILWFIIGRQSSDKAFEAAQAALNETRYLQAIDLFKQFEEKYPTHKLLPEARIGIGKALILSNIRAFPPKWPEGLLALQDFVREFKDSNFNAKENPEKAEALKKDLRGYAEEIAVGAADDAAKDKNRKLLPIPPEALKIYLRQGPNETDAKAFEKKLNQMLAAAEKAIREEETYNQAVAGMKRALDAKPPRPLEALTYRESLLSVYPKIGSGSRSKQKELSELLKESLDAEKALVTSEQIAIAPSTEDHPGAVSVPVSFVMQARTRTDQDSQNRTIFALAKGCCYGVDSATGDPIWRRSIGSQEVDHHAARGRHRRRVVQGSHEARPAYGPRRDPAGRDA